jgi:hypothetical protein
MDDDRLLVCRQATGLCDRPPGGLRVVVAEQHGAGADMAALGRDDENRHVRVMDVGVQEPPREPDERVHDERGAGS